MFENGDGNASCQISTCTSHVSCLCRHKSQKTAVFVEHFHFIASIACVLKTKKENRFKKMGKIFLDHIGGMRLFSCASCDVNLTNRSELISTRFTGATGLYFPLHELVFRHFRTDYTLVTVPLWTVKVTLTILKFRSSIPIPQSGEPSVLGSPRSSYADRPSYGAGCVLQKLWH